MADIRHDLADNGVYHVPDAPSPAHSRRPWALLTGNDLAAPVPESSETLYDDRGQPTQDPLRAVARSVTTGDLSHFYVKVGTGGATKGHLLDPKGVYYDPQDLIRDNRSTGRARYEFAGVDDAAFADYIHYLRTRRVTFLRRAERAVQGG